MRPFCNTWPYPVSDLDLVLPEDNDRVHKARGCCDGWLLVSGGSVPETIKPTAQNDQSCRCQGHAHNSLADRYPAPNGYCLQCSCTVEPS